MPNLYHAAISASNDPTFIVGQSQNEVPQNSCNTFIWWTDGVFFKGDREDELGAIVQNDQQYQALQEEFAQFGEEYLFDLLTQEPEIMNTNTPNEDDIYVNWMDSISETNIGQFYAVMEALDSGNITDAILLNAQINPENVIESNRKTVNYYYLTKYVQGKEIGYEDSLALSPIALQTPYVGGDAVFGARVMLGIDPDEEGLAYKGELDMGKAIEDTYRVYPNPAKEAITVELLNDTFTETTEVVVMDIMGRIVLHHKPAVSAKSIALPLTNLQSGIYVLQVKEANQILFSERIVVNK